MPSSFKYCPITFIVIGISVLYHSTSVATYANEWKRDAHAARGTRHATCGGRRAQ